MGSEASNEDSDEDDYDEEDLHHDYLDEEGNDADDDGDGGVGGREMDLLVRRNYLLNCNNNISASICASIKTDFLF